MHLNLNRARRPYFNPLEALEGRQLLAAHIGNSSTVYATIQAAVNAASPGATINVDAGEYDELVTINKPLTLRGAQAGVDARNASRSKTSAESIVRGQVLGTGNRSTGFYVTANHVVLDGFTVEDDSSSNMYGAGIVLAPNISGTRVLNNIVKDNVAGLYLANSGGDALIQHNVFASNNNVGENSGRGIYSDGGVSGGNLTNVVIDSNTFTSNSGPDKIEAAIGLEAQKVGEQSHITITNNTFTNDGKAVLLINVTDVKIQRNTITGSTDPSSAALRVEGGVSHLEITDNTVKQGKSAAVRIDTKASQVINSDIKINNNNFIANAQGGLIVNEGGYSGVLDATHNYWGSASGPSGDGKGSGDALTANGNNVRFDPWSTTLIGPGSPATNPPPHPPAPPPHAPPPPPPHPIAPPPPPTSVKHKKKKLTNAQKARQHRLAELCKKAKEKKAKKKKQKKHH